MRKAVVLRGRRQVEARRARRWALGGVLVLAFLAAWGTENGTAAAQEPEPSSLRVEVTSIDDGEYPNARIIATVEDTGDAEPAALDASSFSVTVDGEAAHVVSAELASSEDAPLYVLFVIDTSGSMGGAAIAAAKSAAHAFVAELDPADFVGVIGFGNDVTMVQEFTTDRALIGAAIDGLVAEGNTALYQATVNAAATIASAPSPRRAVVLLSDGADFGGKSIATREEALAAAGGAGVPYFAIAQGSDLDRAYLQEMASVTRGRYLTAPTPDELQALYVSIGRLLRSQYAIAFDASGVTPGAEATVQVSVTDGTRTSTSEATYTPGEAFAPRVTLTGIEAGESIDAPRELTLAVSAGAPPVAWYVDGVNVAEQDGPPYALTFEPAQFADGEHTVSVRVGAGGKPIEQSVTFISAVPPPPSSGNATMLLVAVCVAAGAVAAVVAVAWFRSRSSRRGAAISPDQRMTPWAAQIARKTPPEVVAEEEAAPAAPEEVGEPMGLLVSRAGSDAGREYVVGGKPVGIGAGGQCGVRIDDPELSFEEARVWVRGEHLMLHKKTRLSRLEALGEVGGWQILEPGDTFHIGGHMFEFRLLPAERRATPPAEATAGDIPNVLRDRELPDAPSEQPSATPRRFSDLMPRSD